MYCVSCQALDIGGRQLECAMLSPIGPDELLFRLSQRHAEQEGEVLQQLGVTSRKSEVLLWLSPIARSARSWASAPGQ